MKTTENHALAEVLSAAEKERIRTPRLLITLDGPCASGKTTLAKQLAEALDGAVIHTDDYVIPHALKTPERLAVPGGNCDAERLEAEVVIPWRRGDPVRWRRYDCMADRLAPEELLPVRDVLIVEGSYSNLPPIRRESGLRIFVETPWEIRLRRLEQRESPASLKRFFEMWIPLEDAYFAAYGLPDAGCLRVSCGETDPDSETPEH